MVKKANFNSRLNVVLLRIKDRIKQLVLILKVKFIIQISISNIYYNQLVINSMLSLHRQNHNGDYKDQEKSKQQRTWTCCSGCRGQRHPYKHPLLSGQDWCSTTFFLSYQQTYSCPEHYHSHPDRLCHHTGTHSHQRWWVLEPCLGPGHSWCWPQGQRQGEEGLRLSSSSDAGSYCLDWEVVNRG